MINEDFNSVFELFEIFPDEQSCIDHLERLSNSTMMGTAILLERSKLTRLLSEAKTRTDIRKKGRKVSRTQFQG